MIITAALKEWSVAVDALAAGKTILLLRKGGIKEEKGRFSTESDKVILFPTFEHQKPHLLKPKYQNQVTPVESGWHPKIIRLTAWADITHIFRTKSLEQVNALSDFHIWQPQLAVERLKWKANQPLYVLALRVYGLDETIELEWKKSYGGCRSWIGLEEEIRCDESNAAIAETAYRNQVEAISNILSV
ncbi:MAG: DUF1802 family protein [Cyanobacteria bacterium J06621_11]